MIKKVSSLGIVNLAGEVGVVLQIEADTYAEIRDFAQKHVASAEEVAEAKLLPLGCGLAQ